MTVKHPTEVQPEPPTSPDPAAVAPAAPVLPDPPPAQIRPVRYAPGQKVRTRLYGVLDTVGQITPTGNGGRDPLPPGSRGNIIAMAGDELTEAQARLLNG